MASLTPTELAQLRRATCETELRAAEFAFLCTMAEYVVHRRQVAAGTIDPENPVHGLISSFYSHGGMDKLAAICQRATSDESFKSLLLAALNNHLTDLDRRTDRGYLAHRINTRMRQTDRFERLPRGEAYGGCWRLSGQEGEWAGREEDLHAIARGFEFEPQEWNSERRSPIIRDSDLERLLATILEAAGGPLPTAVLHRVVSERIGIGQTPTLVEIETSRDDLHPPEAADPPSDEKVFQTVEEIHDFLSDEDVELLTHYGKSARDVAAETGMGKTTAAKKIKELERTLRDLLDSHEDDDIPTLIEAILRRAGQ